MKMTEYNSVKELREVMERLNKERKNKLLILCLILTVVFGHIVVKPVEAATYTKTNNYVLIAHLQGPGAAEDLFVTQGGAIIGKMGSSGNSTGPHVHLEYRTSNSSACSARINPFGKINLSYVFNYPYIVTNGFGSNPAGITYFCGKHTGIDLIPNPGGAGQNVYSPVYGVITTSEYNSTYGYYVIINVYDKS